MSNPCDISTSAGYLNEAVTHTVGASILGSAVAASILTVALAVTTIEQAQAGDMHQERGAAQVMESAVVSDSVTTRTVATWSKIERARAGDRTYQVIEDNQLSAGLVVSVFDGVQISRTIEQGVVGDLYAHSTQATAYAASSVRGDGFFLARQGSQVQDGGLAQSFAAGAARATAMSLDSAQATSLLFESASASAGLLLDHASASGFITGRVTALAVFQDEALVESFVRDAQASSDLWSCEAESMGMSRLLPGDLSSLAFVDGVLCACAEDGLVAFDVAATAPKISTGLTDFGSSSLKRAGYFYVGYSGQPVTLTVGMTPTGTEVAYSYPLPARAAGAPVPSRAKLGKGARSRYWRMTITGTAFELEDAELIFDETSRKV